LQFLTVAQASLAEVGYCLHVAQRLGYITQQSFAQLEREVDRVGAPLAGLVRSLRATANPMSGTAES
jgi:four helix bundle protein